MSVETGFSPEQESDNKPFLTENISGHNNIEEALENGRVVEIMAIEEKFPDRIPEHLNEVDWAKLRPGQELEASHRCKVLNIVIESKEGTIEAIFKPSSGEDNQAKRVVGVTDSYKCEAAAYEVDKALRLGLVPPTAVKEIDGEAGSLQLFIDLSIAEYHDLNFEDIDVFSKTKEWQYMAALDYLLANPDRSKRNGFNILFTHDLSDPHIFAIDHGLCFAHSESIHLEMAKGPRRQMATEVDPNTGNIILSNRALPEEFLERLVDLVNNPEELTEKMKKIGLKEDTIDTFWIRAKKMAEAGTFL